MQAVIDFVLNLVSDLGYAGIFAMMALESSFFPFPSEVAMVPAGALAQKGEMNFYFALLAGTLGSIFGASINYLIGKYIGVSFIERFGKYFFLNKEKYEKTEKYFKSHGSITTFLGRLIPVIRQYISFPAGTFHMNFGKFAFYTGLGAGIWSLILMVIGYLAQASTEVDKGEYLHYALFGAISFVLIVGSGYYFYNKNKNAKRV